VGSFPDRRNIGFLATCRRNSEQSDLSSLTNAALAWDGPTIVWLGQDDDIPAEYSDFEVLDADRNTVIPGLVDCHTHLAFGGWRGGEFEQRMLGKSYLEIAKAGGGILSTVRETRLSSFDELYAKCLLTLDAMAGLGITTVECKSGYGLNTPDELKLLEVYKALEAEHPLSIVPTFLGAHTVAPEYQSRRQEYIELLTEELIPKVAKGGLAEFWIVEKGIPFELGCRVGTLPEAKPLRQK